ncbi:peptidase dimerization domain-containing protein [Varibaculum prostatecancerukia]|mgnify:CR=1 FL=1|uniref:peptidase dimerization domain-containing protein n=1 Tax=Varibaculum prostatecancerukia TaxID=2811781 RepID=UPI001BFFEA68|nr:peptidase dimerization domain-containing protein [Varibaculum prostatecancerukia]
MSLYPGGALLGSEGFDVLLQGKGGHGSQPHTAVDPIVVGAAVVMRLQTIASRMTNPDTIAVVSVGEFNSGTIDNIIPDSARLLINTRFRDEETRAIIKEGIERIVHSEAQSSGAPEPTVKQLRCWSHHQ